jgi:threonine/homoserine/homoserine lactone efflux protein
MKQNLSIFPFLKQADMLEEYEKKKRKRHAQMLSMMDYTMGTVMLVIGIFFLFLRHSPGVVLNEYMRKPDLLDKILGGMCLLYGSWRIWRGYQKKYFR